MQINVSQLLKAPIGSTRDYDVNEVADIGGSDRLVEGKVRLMRTNRGILVKGVLRTEAEVTCSRCLNVFVCSLTLNIEEEYFPTSDVISGAPLALPDEPGAFTINERHILDLTEAIRQYAILAIPMKPLCRVDCAGLCPECGHNLNQGACGCLPQEIDSHGSNLEEHLSPLSSSFRLKRQGRAL